MAANDYRVRLDVPGHDPVYLWTISPLVRDPDLAAAVLDAVDGTAFRVEVKLDGDERWFEIDPKEH